MKLTLLVFLSIWIVVANQTLGSTRSAEKQFLVQGKTYTDLKSRFSTGASFNSPNEKHRKFTLWTESIVNLKLHPSFEKTNTHGFAFYQTTLRFHQNLNTLERSIFNHPNVQGILFPLVKFYDCTIEACRAQQEISALLPDAHYVSHYRFLKIDDETDLQTKGLPRELFHDTSHFPKYLLVQLATDWSQYFHRASSIAVFEPDNEGGWIRISSYQTMSLTAISSIGKGTLKSALEDQVQSFLIAFKKL
jgi:hypothetical protein